MLNSLFIPRFDFERAWWRLFQKSVVRTNFVIYVFIKSMMPTMARIRVDGLFMSLKSYHKSITTDVSWHSSIHAVENCWKWR
jgi:hypothetical protein